jgi:phosphoribosylglycinamide formyltransferase-1
MTPPMRIAVLASGEGTTLQSIVDAIRARRLDAQVVLVVSNNRNSGALERAAAAAIPTAHLSGVTHPDPDKLDQAICAALLKSRADVVVLAGYMKKIGRRTLEKFAGRVLNTHPSILPRHGGQGMYGRRVHDAVLASGDAETGVSVHLVDAEYDTGPVIAQTRVPVQAGIAVEQLEQAVQALERLFLCATLQRVACGQLALKARRTWGVFTSPRPR